MLNKIVDLDGARQSSKCMVRIPRIIYILPNMDFDTILTLGVFLCETQYSPNGTPISKNAILFAKFSCNSPVT